MDHAAATEPRGAVAGLARQQDQPDQVVARVLHRCDQLAGADIGEEPTRVEPVQLSALDPAWYPALRMTRVTNFGDPSFEPTDEELAELMREAFADVPARSAAALARIRQEIEELRAQAMARLEQRLGGSK